MEDLVAPAEAPEQFDETSEDRVVTSGPAGKSEQPGDASEPTGISEEPTTDTNGRRGTLHFGTISFAYTKHLAAYTVLALSDKVFTAVQCNSYLSVTDPISALDLESTTAHLSLRVAIAKRTSGSKLKFSERWKPTIVLVCEFWKATSEVG